MKEDGPGYGGITRGGQNKLLMKIMGISDDDAKEMSKPNEAKKLKKFITHLVLISNETLYLFDNDKEKALKWIQTPNDFFIDNLSPFEMALVGKGKSVLKKLCEFSGRDSDHLID